MVVFRPAIRSDWEKSMQRMEKFESEAEMIANLSEKITNDYKSIGLTIVAPIQPYVDMSKETADDRNGWLHTRLVRVKGYPGMGDNDIVLGFADTETFKDKSL